MPGKRKATFWDSTTLGFYTPSAPSSTVPTDMWPVPPGHRRLMVGQLVGCVAGEAVFGQPSGSEDAQLGKHLAV